MASRTRRVAIDGGFQTAGNDWYDSGSSVAFGTQNHVEFSLPFALSLGGYGSSVSTVTLWNDGVLSLGSATQAQIDFMQSGTSPIPDAGNAGFPGLFFMFDYNPGSAYDFFSYGIGVADYDPPYNDYEAVSAAFFTFDNGYQIILDQYGFSIVEEAGSATSINGYYIGALHTAVTGQDIDEPYYPDFLTYAGTSGADDLSGTDYNDRFLSSAGADTIDGKNGTDLISYSASSSGITVNLALGTGAGGDAQGDHLANIEDLDGSNYADSITGTVFDNRLNGFGGNDIIAGGNGDDTIEGGAGADNLDGGTGVDTLSYYNSPAAVTVSLADSTATGGDATGDTIVNFDAVLGSQFDDVLIASAAGSFLSSQNGDDVLLGSSGADQLSGGYGDDFLTGGPGADRLDGGYGSDTVSFADSPAALTINLGVPSLSGGDGTGDQLVSIENVIGTLFADVMVGSFDDNRLEGGDGDDTLSGRGGNDTLLGSAGADQLDGEDGNDTLMGGDGNDLLNGGTGVDVLTGGAGADILSGGAGNDILSGEDGNDTLDGGAGADAMQGSGGNDTYVIDNAGDVVLEGASAGTDLVQSAVSYTLGANLENLTLVIGAGAINGTGNGLTNVITGNNANNVIDGKGGADTMAGGLGNDTYVVDNAGDVVTEGNAAGTDLVQSAITYVLGNNLENLTLLVGFGAINGTGNALANVITGNNAPNVLSGGAGNDTLDGGLGNDTLDGGADSDTASYAAAAAAVAVDLRITTAQNTAAAGSDTLLNIENLTGSAFADTLIGNDASNVLIGGSGNDSLSGYGGNDTLAGNFGNDILYGGAGDDALDGGIDIDTASYVSAAAAVAVDLRIAAAQNTAGAGNDTLVNIENLAGSLFGDSLMGNSIDNLLIGYDGNDLLVGNFGNDTLSGNQNNDTLDGGAGNDTMDGGLDIDTATYISATSAVTADLRITIAQNTFGAGSDTLINIENLTGSVYADTLNGNSIDNVLMGQSGNDSLFGNFGNDTLFGNQGSDLLDGGVGNDMLDGGVDFDTATYASATAGVGVDLRITTAQNTVGSGNDTLLNIENVTGSAYNDTLTGNSIDNVLIGMSGNDTLSGNFGNDALFGGVGKDTLVGGAGNDSFVFDVLETTANADTISDFLSGSDHIDLFVSAFASLSSYGLGTLDPGELAFGSAAATPSDHLIYDQSTGNLYYDADGSGGGAQVQIAHLTGNPTIVAADIILV